LLPDSSLEIQSQQEIKYDTDEEARSYYEKGRELHDLRNYLTAEIAFLKAIKLAENTDIKVNRSPSLLF